MNANHAMYLARNLSFLSYEEVKHVREKLYETIEAGHVYITRDRLRIACKDADQVMTNRLPRASRASLRT